MIPAVFQRSVSYRITTCWANPPRFAQYGVLFDRYQSSHVSHGRRPFSSQGMVSAGRPRLSTVGKFGGGMGVGWRCVSAEECMVRLANCDRYFLDISMCCASRPCKDFSTFHPCFRSCGKLWLIDTPSHRSHIVTTTASFLILYSLYPSTIAALTKVVLLCALLHLCDMIRPRITNTAMSTKCFHPPQAPRIASCALPTQSNTRFS